MTKILLTTEPQLIVTGKATTLVVTPEYSKVFFSTEPLKQHRLKLWHNELTVSKDYSIYAWVENEPTLIDVFGSSGHEQYNMLEKLKCGEITQEVFDKQLEVQVKTNREFSEKADKLRYLVDWFIFENGICEITKGATHDGFTHHPEEYDLVLDHKIDLEKLGYFIKVVKWENRKAKGVTLYVSKNKHIDQIQHSIVQKPSVSSVDIKAVGLCSFIAFMIVVFLFYWCASNT